MARKEIQKMRQEILSAILVFTGILVQVESVNDSKVELRVKDIDLEGLKKLAPPDRLRALGALALKIGKFDTDKTVAMLLEKNRRYGNSALNPIRVVSTAGPLEQIYVRIDDKLNRLLSDNLGDDEDPLFDLYGYCILGLIAHMKGTE